MFFLTSLGETKLSLDPSESLTFFKAWEVLYEERLKSSLLKDEFVKANLDPLFKAIQHSKKVFKETGSFDFCARCAASGTKCCEAGLEWMLSPAEFLINLLLADEKGTKIEFNLERKEDCLFLGEKGCNLIYTPIFCRNFFCPELSDYLGERIKAIQHALEEEAVIGFKLGDHITKNYILPLNQVFEEVRTGLKGDK